MSLLSNQQHSRLCVSQHEIVTGQVFKQCFVLVSLELV